MEEQPASGVGQEEGEPQAKRRRIEESGAQPQVTMLAGPCVVGCRGNDTTKPLTLVRHTDTGTQPSPAGSQHGHTVQQPGSQHAEVQPQPNGSDPTRQHSNSAAGTSGKGGVSFKQPSGAYTLREEFLLQQERSGELTHQYFSNDGQHQHLIWLIALKNIFSKQLPNMPREYICRLLFDRRHRSVALVSRNGTVVAGITYRVFQQQALGEIAFCAVTASEQVKGFGTRLMNACKECARSRDQLSHLLTYADNNAVGYFSKQGFTREVTLSRERWGGYIKDYDGGTLMECVLHPKVPYTEFPDMIQAQKAALDNRIRALSNSHVVHPGLQHFLDGVSDSLAVFDIPGVREAGWTPENAPQPRYKLLSKDGSVEASPDALQRFMEEALQELEQMEDSWPFRYPVDPKEVVDYHDIIKDPLDLQTLGERLQQGRYYRTLEMFVADVKRIVANARYYNSSDTIYYKMANRMEAWFEQYLSGRLAFEPAVQAA